VYGLFGRGGLFVGQGLPHLHPLPVPELAETNLRHSFPPFSLPVSRKKQNKKVANPSPLGLFAFALTSLLMAGANTTLTEDGTTQHRVACYGLMYGGLAQVLAAVYEMKRGSTFGATTFYTYGGYWVGLSLLTLLHDGAWYIHVYTCICEVSEREKGASEAKEELNPRAKRERAKEDQEAVERE